MLRTTLPLYLLERQGLALNYRVLHCILHKRCFSTSDGSDNDNSGKEVSEKSPVEKSLESKAKSRILSKEETKENAKKKLFSLLSELKVDPENLNKTQSKLNLAKAVKRPLKSERFREILEQKEITPEEKIENAAKRVAETVRGDPKETLAQLNEKLRILNLAKQPPMPVEDMNADDVNITEEIGKKLLQEEGNKNIMSSVEEVADAVTGGPINKSSLSQRLLRLSLESQSSGAPRKSLDDLVKSMKVDRNKPEPLKVRNEQEETPQPFKRKPPARIYSEAKFDLYQAPPLNLTIEVDNKVDIKDTVWKKLEENRLKLLVQFAPTNAFEEMIMWTEQGKHWKFPIDNETEIGEEENVGFNEHIFLEEHLHGFPTKGPIRHFMELVVVGLSLNPYISVERKIENIDWFRDYFKEKETILQELGALG